MTYVFSQRGIAPALIVLIVAVVLIGGGAAFYFSNQLAPLEETRMEDTRRTGEDVPMQGAVFSTPMPDDTMAKLAGTSAPLLDFTKADFDAAVQSDKLVVLYFFANWCPICTEEFPKMQSAFNELSAGNVIGFRVNYNDPQTDADEKELARQQGVAYQHTKVFLKNGQQILKSPETWSKDRYLTEINKASAP